MHSEKEKKKTRRGRARRGGYQKLLLAADAECKEETDATAAAAGNQNFEFVPVPCDWAFGHLIPCLKHPSRFSSFAVCRVSSWASSLVFFIIIIIILVYQPPSSSHRVEEEPNPSIELDTFPKQITKKKLALEKVLFSSEKNERKRKKKLKSPSRLIWHARSILFGF